MTVYTYLSENVGWQEDVNVEEVHFEYECENGLAHIKTYAMDDQIDSTLDLTYFYALSADGFYWGSLGGELLYFDYASTLFDFAETEDLAGEDSLEDFFEKYKNAFGTMVTDSIIDDKDAFRSFQFLISYRHIYSIHPLLKKLKKYLTKYYQDFLSAA